MDVCKYHSKLPIADCPVSFLYDSPKRKQLVAAILRFCDELDVDCHRVSIETVKNFALDPHNSLYWWLHNRTKIIFKARNVISISVLLHSEDAGKYGDIIYDNFIIEFQSKNRPVLSVLAQNGIPIVISADSQIEELDRTDLLPSEIVLALLTLQQKQDPLTDLVNEVRVWLQSIRYEINNPLYSDNRSVDMIATLDLGTVKQRILVRCIGGKITAADVEKLDAILDKKTPQGWLISDKAGRGSRS